MKDDSQFKRQAKPVAAAVNDVPLQTEAHRFPWSFYLVEATMLLGQLKLPFDRQLDVLRALKHSLDGCSDKKVDKTTESFLKKIRTLTSEQRRHSCVLCCAGVILRSGRALRRDSSQESDATIFPDNPQGWIRNGLWCIEEHSLGSLEGRLRFNFVECRALAFSPSSDSPDAAAESVIPMLYVGEDSWRRDIERWRAGFWYRDVKEGYALKGHELIDHWRKMVPGASEPDPVFRFLTSPSAQLQREAELFMRQAVGTTVIGAPGRDGPPPQFKYGPCRCSRAQLNRWLSGNPRQDILKQSLWSPQNPQGSIWLHPDTPTRSRIGAFHFMNEEDYLKAAAARSTNKK